MSSPGQEGGQGPVLAEEETEKQGEEVASAPVCLSIYRHSQAATYHQAWGTMKCLGQTGFGQAAEQRAG